ncbi:MAG: hypothetical protein ACJAQT_004858 [Akkermansiaceae bacterium]
MRQFFLERFDATFLEEIGSEPGEDYGAAKK